MALWKRLRTLGGLAAAVTATVVIGAPPAAASGDYSGLAFIRGGGVFSNDWDDEGKLSTTRHASSNATCLWQKILWADGRLSWNDIDGIFGDKTQQATKAWQRDWDVDDDGVVGKDTFAAAGNWLRDIDGNNAVDTYIGTNGSFKVARNGDGDYTFYDRSGNARVAGYNYLTCS
ncbi:peptidoglycan-binding domain-containing protein [Streptomyces cinereoruber]|uniref:peptidoglycan-binding domain-containing protein n=1 Tax=Streptomyces cinereoruber TaxID=67260 RepID=UPI003394F5FE